MPIVLLRVDERLIHGQVVVGWGGPLHADHLVVVDDDIAGSPDDEDGVTLPATLVAGTSASVTIRVAATSPFYSNLLDAWIDFNRDGDWSDPGEQVFTSRALAAGAVSADVVAIEARKHHAAATGTAPTDATATAHAPQRSRTAVVTRHVRCAERVGSDEAMMSRITGCRTGRPSPGTPAR